MRGRYTKKSSFRPGSPSHYLQGYFSRWGFRRHYVLIGCSSSSFNNSFTLLTFFKYFLDAWIATHQIMLPQKSENCDLSQCETKNVISDRPQRELRILRKLGKVRELQKLRISKDSKDSKPSIVSNDHSVNKRLATSALRRTFKIKYWISSSFEAFLKIITECTI